MNVGIKDIEIVKNNILTSNDEKTKTFLTLKFEFYKTNISLTEINDFIKEVQGLCDVKAPTTLNDNASNLYLDNDKIAKEIFKQIESRWLNLEGENFYNAYQDLIENREDWVHKKELIEFLQYETNPHKYKKYIKEIKQLENSYLYIQGTAKTNQRFNKVRIYNYINSKEREMERVS